MRPVNLSNLMHVAELRYLQSLYEVGELRGPDTFVYHFLPFRRRLYLRCFPQRRLVRARSDPFYYYLVARTRCYDDLFSGAVRGGAKCLVNIGCGRDTRLYRFGQLLHENHVHILECDQAEAITDRRRTARRLNSSLKVSYAAVDLNSDAQPELEQWLERNRGGRVFVMLEGVSPYVRDEAFDRFLGMLGRSLPSQSCVAFDSMFSGIPDDLGKHSLFRVPTREEVFSGYCRDHGFRLVHFETSSDLTARFLPSVVSAGHTLYTRDCLVQLEIAR